MFVFLFLVRGILDFITSYCCHYCQEVNVLLFATIGQWMTSISRMAMRRKLKAKISNNQIMF